MKTTGNTVLITGGSAGIGLAIARAFAANGNQVIITGRNEARLQAAAAELKNVTAIPCDVNSEADVQRLAERVQKDFPGLNVLVNNAGTAFAYKLSAGALAFEKAREHGIPASDVADALLEALRKDEYEIHVGQTADIYQLSRSAPAEALLVMNAAQQ